MRVINAATGIITTLAGTGSANFNGDGIPATSANLNNPLTVVLNSSGNLLIADSLNYRVRMLDMSSGLIWTLAGNGSAVGCCGVVNGIQATEAPLDSPAGLAISASGELFVSELRGNRVRQVALPSPYASTAVTISANATSIPYGMPVTLTATISAINGLGTSASGQVIFLDSVAPNGLGGPGVAGGLAILTATSLSQGVHVITAMYSGDSAFGYSVSAPFTVTVTAPQASVTMAANPNPAAANQPVTLTATLTPSIAPGGVTFFNGSTALGSAKVLSGTATLPGIALAAGTYSLTAQYSGSGTFPAATSPDVQRESIQHKAGCYFHRYCDSRNSYRHGSIPGCNRHYGLGNLDQRIRHVQSCFLEPRYPFHHRKIRGRCEQWTRYFRRSDANGASFVIRNLDGNAESCGCWIAGYLQR